MFLAKKSIAERNVRYLAPNQNDRLCCRLLLVRTYDTASRIKTVAETGLTNKSFAYDALDRLAGMTIGTAVTTYAYDADSNRTSVKTAAGTTTYTYPTTNNKLSKLAGLTAQTHAYDAAGNLISDGTRAYAYDARGRMATATVGGVTTTYGINGLGQQAAKTGSAVSTGGAEFVYDEQGHLIGEYNKTGGVVQETVYLGDTPIAVLKGTTAAPVVYAVMAERPLCSASSAGAGLRIFGARPFPAIWD
jgi:YD repeat-containing protein